MIITKELPQHHRAVEELTRCAFATAEHSDGQEHHLVAALRTSTDFIPDLSLVALDHGHPIGHIMFTRGHVDTTPVLVLAPLSVHPDHQRQGIGGALITHGHRIGAQHGFTHSVVLGSDTYYPRFGYQPAHTLGITPPFEVRAENFMATTLTDEAPELKGTLRYPKEFGID